MRIQVLSDNRKLHNIFEREHGLCIYIETDRYKCLLDTGASDKFLQNAENLEIDIASIDYVFISHGHSDHIGGLKDFLKINSKAKIVVSKKALIQQFYSTSNGLKEISIDINLKGIENRFVFVNLAMTLENEIHIFPCQNYNHPMPKANKTLYKKFENDIISDDFNHEIIVCFGCDVLLVYTGCAHHGLLNILDTVQNSTGKRISTLIGGFHLPDGYEGQYETEEEINKLAHELISHYPTTKFYTGHCTGMTVYQQLKRLLGNQLINFYTGYTIII